MNEKALREMREWVISIVIAAIIAFGIKAFLFDIKSISGPSMEPTLNDYDRVTMEKVSIHRDTFKRGEIIIFNPSNGSKNPYVKRIIGLPGEKVDIKNGSVYINDVKLDEPYLKPGTFTNNNMSLTVPKGQLFVLGDHREISEDSRVLGPISINSIEGHVIFRIYPFNKTRSF